MVQDDAFYLKLWNTTCQKHRRFKRAKQRQTYLNKHYVVRRKESCEETHTAFRETRNVFTNQNSVLVISSSRKKIIRDQALKQNRNSRSDCKVAEKKQPKKEGTSYPSQTLLLCSQPTWWPEDRLHADKCISQLKIIAWQTSWSWYCPRNKTGVQVRQMWQE